MDGKRHPAAFPRKDLCQTWSTNLLQSRGYLQDKQHCCERFHLPGSQTPDLASLLCSVPHMKGHRYLLQPVAHQRNLGLSSTGGLKLSSPPFICAYVNRKIMAKWDQKPHPAWLYRVCLSTCRGVEEVEERIGDCFAGMVLGRKQAAVFATAHFSVHNAHNY